ncbi:tetratricopeptide repeat protein [Streptomyces chilikensis]|uniref:Tetratricopeptide repeat protein n=1 Tax=Streptomyces chilikensis TaxID=1194079 RepID=A0ABV3ELT2_9ACTN
MTSVTSLDELRRAIAENGERPEGPARNARAEQLLADAESLGTPLAVIEALGHQLTVYNYSSEKDKAFVPFARLLRMWDERPEDFDAYETHSLFWRFKWMSTGMLGQPHIPLDAMENWLEEMERRYRLAGHSERAVRSCEFHVASHVGDMERAERAYQAWLSADRDRMADCYACELQGQGWWQVLRGRDEEALEVWAPVLEGRFTCAHEPHNVLASSLLPLLRLGRLDEAKANHLRGFRLVRATESMRASYAEHVEFCALTGNEARALELLAQRPAYFTDDGHPSSKKDYLAVTALLMDRLVALGMGDRRVPGPAGREWTAAELAAHAREEALALADAFDRRNGTTHVGDRLRERMAREPLVDRLPLGVRVPVATTVPRPAAPAAAASSRAGDLAALLAEARRRSEALLPSAVEAWEAVERAAGDSPEGAELSARDRAEIAEHRALGLGPDGADLFAAAAALYAEAGDLGEALASRARGVYARTLSGKLDGALEEVTEPYRQCLALFAAGDTGVRQTASVLMARARVLMRLTQGADGQEPEPAAEAEAAGRAREAAREVLAFVAGHAPDTEDPHLLSRTAEAHAMLGDLAAGPEQAVPELTLAVRQFLDAGLPWYTVEYESRLAAIAHHLDDLEAAERHLRAALEHGGEALPPLGHAHLHLQLCEVLTESGDDAVAEAAEHALEAAYWADEAGQSATLGAYARHRLGGLLHHQGRWAEAAEVMESTLPDLTPQTHGDGTVVQTLWWLGDCLASLGDHRDSAERRLQAAELAARWPEQRDHATLAHLAAESLSRAGLPSEADAAYARAGELWRGLGDLPGQVRALRARAWLAAEEEVAAARALMERALDACREVLAVAQDDGERLPAAAELAGTHHQFGGLLADHEGPSEEAHGHLVEAVSGFAALGGPARAAHADALLTLGRLEAALGRSADAAARAREVLTACDAEPDPAGPLRSRRSDAETLLREATA